MSDNQKQDVRRELHSLLQSNAISKSAFDHVDSALGHEWGAYKGTAVEPAPGTPDQLFTQLDVNLRQLCQANALSQAALGTIYLVISQERAGQPVVGTPVSNPEVQKKHRSLFGGHKSGQAGGSHHKLNLSASRLGQIVIDSVAGGFGFRLGADAANEVVHGLF